jgi:type I restriction enzyme R subunit
VKESADHVDAIGILLDKPREWGTKPLGELQTLLTRSREGFTPERLRKAHELHYHKALVDIISMIKHAAREDEPLLTAEERVSQALRKITAGKEFTSEQQEWLDHIRRHLVANLSIDEDDFEVMPVFSREGGLGKARRIFGGQLPDLIRRLNEEIAA